MTNQDIDLSIPTPDPAWDYAEIWPELHKLKARIETLIKYVAEQERASDFADTQICEDLRRLVDAAEEIKYLLNTDPKDRDYDDEDDFPF